MARGSYRFIALLACAACSSRSQVPTAADAPPGDYGDAPEGAALDGAEGKTAAFPTKSRDGARVLDVERAWLGSSGTVERGAEDPSDPDGRPNLDYDKDDGLDEMVVKLENGKPKAAIAVDVVTTDRHAKYWLNVLVDLDTDGKWSGAAAGGELEWAVQNLEVTFDDKTQTRVELPSFPFSNGADVPQKVWMRIALTNVLVPKPWDGSGQFASGEIEDYLVELPAAPLVDVRCDNPEQGSGAWTFSGQRTANVSCRLKALNDEARGALPFISLRSKGGVTQGRLCTGAKVDQVSTEREVSGTVDLESGQANVSCLFVKEWGLPSEFSFEVPTGRAKSVLTAHGVEAGLLGANSAQFRLEKGDCARSCRREGECFGGRSCDGECCVPLWADECETLGTAECGRCCALSAGARAADCVRSACAK